MSLPPDDFHKLKQQHDLASFHEGRIRDLATPVLMVPQTLALLLSILALLASGDVLAAAQLKAVLYVALLAWAAMIVLVRWNQERRALQVRAEYEQEHLRLFGEPPRIELVGFALPAPRRRKREASPVKATVAPESAPPPAASGAEAIMAAH